MNKEEMLKKFTENVEHLQKTVPADDIYIFTEQTFMAALFFMQKWSEWVDIKEECSRDPIVNKWVKNIAAYLICRENKQEMQLYLNMDSVEEE